jgi:hypothetical protein
METTESALRKMYERTRYLLNAIGELQVRENPSEEDIEQLAFLRTELAGLCPPERYAWIDGLPVIDIVAELAKLEDERRKKQMDAIESRKNLMFKAMLEAIEPAVRDARSDRDRAFGKLESVRGMTASIKDREDDLNKRLDVVKNDIVGSVERGKSLETLVKKSTEIRAELDALKELAEDIEDNRLPAAQADLERAEEELKRQADSVLNTCRASFQEDLNRIIRDEVEAILLAWPAAVWEIVTALKLRGGLSPSGLNINSPAVRQHSLPY